MSGAVYGGDEVGALVIDIGTHTTKAGYAGEDTPKAHFPTYIGRRDVEPTMDVDGAAGSGKARREYFVGNMAMKFPRANTEVFNPLRDGLIHDWEGFEAILDHIFNDELRLPSNERPVMFCEPSWNPPEIRQRVVQILFEKYNVPALFLCRNAVLSAYSAGRSTGIVLDSGAAGASAVPVYDGYAILKGIKRNAIGGNFVTAQYKLLLSDRMGIELVPATEIKGKSVVPEGEPAVWERRTNLPELSASLRGHFVDDLVRDFQMSLAKVAERPYDEQTLAILPTTHYEFPNGYNQQFGIERYRIPEVLFFPETFSLKTTEEAKKEAESLNVPTQPPPEAPAAPAAAPADPAPPEGNGSAAAPAPAAAGGLDEGVKDVAMATEPDASQPEAASATPAAGAAADPAAAPAAAPPMEATAAATPAAAAAAAAPASSAAPAGLPKPRPAAATATAAAAAAAEQADQIRLAGHQKLIAHSINNCDVDIQQALWSSIIVAGANTLHAGYVDRLHQELVDLAPPGSKLKIIATPTSHERVFAAWIGGSILASLGSFQQLWLSRSEYDDFGKAVVDKKCP